MEIPKIWGIPNLGVMFSNFVGKDIGTVGKKPAFCAGTSRKKMGIQQWEFQSQSENLGEASSDQDLFLV